MLYHAFPGTAAFFIPTALVTSKMSLYQLVPFEVSLQPEYSNCFTSALPLPQGCPYIECTYKQLLHVLVCLATDCRHALRFAVIQVS